ncbi:hypothetical protein Dimus_035684 [Dionaea muscipula]
MIFVEDVPESMNQVELRKLFSRFGVVIDAFIPRKLNKGKRRFGFVRYDCPVAAEVAIQRTNGIWIRNKESKVKFADFGRKELLGIKPLSKPERFDGGMERCLRLTVDWVRPLRSSRWSDVERSRPSLKLSEPTVGLVRPLPRGGGRTGRDQVWVLLKKGRSSMNHGSYAEVVKKGPLTQHNIPTIKVETIGNGWLYRSVVATFADHRSSDSMFESFMKEARGIFTADEIAVGAKSFAIVVAEEQSSSSIIRNSDVGALAMPGKTIRLSSSTMNGDGDDVAGVWGKRGHGWLATERGVQAIGEASRSCSGIENGLAIESGAQLDPLPIQDRVQFDGLGQDRPMSSKTGPELNFDGFNQEIILGDWRGNSNGVLPKMVSADTNRSKYNGGMGSWPMEAETGEPRGSFVQGSEPSIPRLSLEEAIGGTSQEVDARRQGSEDVILGMASGGNADVLEMSTTCNSSRCSTTNSISLAARLDDAFGSDVYIYTVGSEGSCEDGRTEDNHRRHARDRIVIRERIVCGLT